ncbi:hypothetical protein GCM10027422_47460 [Hymenobacter arcticus]
MAGHYLNNASYYSDILRKWSKNVIQYQLWNRSSDIHLDEIDSTFKNDNEWIDASIFMLNLTFKLIDISKYSLLLVIPFAYTEESTNVSLINKEFASNRLDTTPPSIYLFPLEHKNLLSTLNKAVFIKNSGFDKNFKVYFEEHKEANEYFGFLYITK